MLSSAMWGLWGLDIELKIPFGMALGQYSPTWCWQCWPLFLGIILFDSRLLALFSDAQAEISNVLCLNVVQEKMALI